MTRAQIAGISKLIDQLELDLTTSCLNTEEKQLKTSTSHISK